MEKKKLLKCKQCSYATIFDFALNHHTFRHRLKLNEHYPCLKPVNSYECKKCSHKSLLKVDLQQHMKNSCYSKIESEAFEYKCELCNFRTYSSLIHAKHEKQCFMNYRCDFCSSKFISEHDLTSHTSNIHNINIKWLKCPDESDESEESQPPNSDSTSYYKCEFCPYMAQLHSSFKLHLLHKHPTENIELFHCGICDYKTIHQNTLNAHVRSLHSTPLNVWFQCNKCAFKAKTKQVFQRHKVEHFMADVNKPFKCNVCYRSFCTNTSLTEHHKRAHLAAKADDKRLMCKFCKFKGKSEEELKFHEVNKLCVPETTKWFRCEFCAFMTNYELSLKLHIKKCSKRK